MHVSRADLDDVRDAGDLLHVARVEQLRDDRSPVSSRASTRISSPFEPSPWNAYGDERGLNAPPRSIVTPAAAPAPSRASAPSSRRCTGPR